MDIYLSKDKLSTFTDGEVAVYVALKTQYDSMITNEKDDVIIYSTIKQMIHTLSGSFKVPRKAKDKLYLAIKKLIDKNSISLVDSDIVNNKITENTLFRFNIKNLRIKSKEREQYLIIPLKKIQELYNARDTSNFKILKVGLNVIGTINSKTKCGYASTATLSKISGLKSSKTIGEMMKLFEEKNILYVKHSDTSKRDSNGQIKNLSNCYGYPRYKKEIDDFYYERCKDQGYDFTKDRINSNQKTVISKNYDAFIKGKYNGDLVELCADVMAYNEDYYSIKNKQQKNLNIFDKETIEQASQIDIRETINKLNQKKETNTPNNKLDIISKVIKHETVEHIEDNWDITEDIVEHIYEKDIRNNSVQSKDIIKERKPKDSEIKFINKIYNKQQNKNKITFWEEDLYNNLIKDYGMDYIQLEQPIKQEIENPF